MSICVPPTMPLNELQKPALDPKDALSAYYRATTECPCHHEYWCEDYVMRPEKVGIVAAMSAVMDQAIEKGDMCLAQGSISVAGKLTVPR